MSISCAPAPIDAMPVARSRGRFAVVGFDLRGRLFDPVGLAGFATYGEWAGAGLVTLAVPESALATAKAALTEATFLPLPETEGGGVSEDAWGAVAERLERRWIAVEWVEEYFRASRFRFE